ncbi:hypothetical protein M422DRAFT_254129 [Sphaerobolus stellatus SS14]|uniref:Uncharacterized protein n=1 Tax=Sphaerobolus stellatus (strain SS14) TaxID=990650 RepID=A0A0C9V6T2_SPHS4|nr:hypothetical protein M422DRAFT_254129 [Sphaerobolus stellatus SS14]
MKATYDTKLHADLDALHEGSRIRIRTSGGVFEVSLVAVNTSKSPAEVIWDGGAKREFKWGSIVWGSVGEGGVVVRKPRLEELAKTQQTIQPNQQPPPPPSTRVGQLQFQAAYTPARVQVYYASVAAAASTSSSSSQYQGQTQTTTTIQLTTAAHPTTLPTTQPTTTPYAAYQHYYPYYSYGQVPYGATSLPSTFTQPTTVPTTTPTNPTPTPAPAPAPAPAPIPTLALSPTGYQPPVSMAGTNVAKYEGMGSFRVELEGCRTAVGNGGAGAGAGGTTGGTASNGNKKTTKGRNIRPAPSTSTSNTAAPSGSSSSLPTKSTAKAKSTSTKPTASIAPVSPSQPKQTPHPGHGHPYMSYYAGYYSYAAYGEPVVSSTTRTDSDFDDARSESKSRTSVECRGTSTKSSPTTSSITTATTPAASTRDTLRGVYSF